MKHILIILAISYWYCPLGQDQYLSFDFTCNSEQTRNHMISIDRRTNPELLGYMPIKGYSGLANVRFKGALADSIGNFFSNQSNDQNIDVLILENFFLNCGSSPGKLILSMRLYSQASEGHYAHICSIDTIYQLNNGDPFGRINELFCDISKLVNAENAKPMPDTSFVRKEDLTHLDSLEKLNIPIYVAAKPVSGIYKDYAHFKMNKPDISTDMFIRVTKKGIIEVDRAYKGKKRKVKLDPTGIYAVSDGDRVLKVTSSGEYFPVIKHGFDFYYDRPGYFYDQPNTFSPYYFPVVAGSEQQGQEIW